MDEQKPESEAALPWLLGARVERVDGPLPGLFSITLYAPGEKQCLVLAVSERQRGVGASKDRPKGEAASAFVRRLRTKIEGARLVSLRWLGGATQDHATALELTFRRAEGEERIVADFDAKAPNLLLLSADGRVLGAADEAGYRKRAPDRKLAYAPGPGRGIARIDTPQALLSAGEALSRGAADRGEDAFRTQARARAKAALKRAQRKADAIRGDLERAAQAPQLRREANAMLCNLASIARGSTSARLLDESVEPAEWLDITLDPARDARQNAEHRFERARKLERGIAIAQQRLASVQHEIASLNALLTAVDSDEPQAIVSKAEEAGLALDIKPPSSPRRRTEPREHVAFRTFRGSQGRKLLVGKGAADNDTLTLTIARPHDHWVHARGLTGSHVIVPLDKNAQIAPELLLDAAHLAAHFSDARGERTVEIQHTARRHLRKPKGAAPGLVIVDREKVLLLRVDEARLQRLLASELRDT